MAVNQGQSRHRGLPSVNEARAERRRALVTGRARIYGGSPQFWLWTAIVLVTFGILYWKHAEGQLASQKSAVMAKQRAIHETLGAKLLPFQEKVERWTLALAAEAPVPVVASGLDVERIATTPGAYLRLRLGAAADVDSLRRAAARSVRDGFTSCLFVRKEDTVGPPCRSPSDCAPGLLCSDLSVCARPSQPYNLRLAYRALRVLSPLWVEELHQAPTDLAVRAFELDLDAVSKNDVPLAIELLTRARLFTVVLDEDPAAGLPPALERPVGEAPESEEERLQRTPHAARVAIWDLTTDQLLLRAREDASADFASVGERATVEPALVAAQQRQVNSCALALAVRERVAAAHAEAGAAPAGSAGAAGAPAGGAALPPAPAVPGAASAAAGSR